VLDGVGPVRFEKSRRAHRVFITVRASGGMRVTVPMRVPVHGPASAVRFREYSLTLF
jgi:predicted metal-dependent hydrolase